MSALDCVDVEGCVYVVSVFTVKNTSKIKVEVVVFF